MYIYLIKMYLQKELQHTEAEFTLKEAQKVLTLNKFKYDKIRIYKKNKEGILELVEEHIDSKTYQKEQEVEVADAFVGRFVELSKEEKKIELKLKTIKEERNLLEKQVLDYMLQNDRPRFRQGGLTVYISEDITASLKEDKEKAIDYLKAEGFEALVKENYNTNSIKKLFKDSIKLGDQETQLKLSTIFDFQKHIQVKTRLTD